MNPNESRMISTFEPKWVRAEGAGWWNLAAPSVAAAAGSRPQYRLLRQVQATWHMQKPVLKAANKYNLWIQTQHQDKYIHLKQTRLLKMAWSSVRPSVHVRRQCTMQSSSSVYDAVMIMIIIVSVRCSHHDTVNKMTIIIIHIQHSHDDDDHHPCTIQSS